MGKRLYPAGGGRAAGGYRELPAHPAPQGPAGAAAGGAAASAGNAAGADAPGLCDLPAAAHPADAGVVIGTIAGEIAGSAGQRFCRNFSWIGHKLVGTCSSDHAGILQEELH